MREISIRLILPTAILILSSVSAWAAGGSPVPSTDPADQAAEAYNSGIENRDKAWQLEAQAASSADPDERAKLEKRAQKEYEKAIRAFRSATQSDPGMYQAFSSLGYALRKTGNYEEALAAYNQALQLEPGYAEAIEYRAEAYLGLNRLDEVKEAYMRLFREDRERADELMVAMQRWIDARRIDPQGVDGGALEEFSVWVEERLAVAGNTAVLHRESNRAW
jgi:tetratricopeptide (TPR) repeat protein